MPSDQNIADVLAAEAEAAERGRDVDAHYVPSRRRSKDPAQVYSVRLPTDRLEELRQLAMRQHMAPSTLLRRWVVERLDRELDHASLVAESRETYSRPDEDEVLVVTRGQLDSLIHGYLYDHAGMIARLVRDSDHPAD